MKVDKTALKQIQEWLSLLSDYYIDLSDDSEFFDEDKLEELPDEVEIEEMCLSFPDDQEYSYISPEDFIFYMSEINSLRRDGDAIVRTDHIIQAVISSERMGYTSFEEKLQSFTFEGEDIDVKIIKGPFLIGVMNAKEGRYEKDFGFGACEPYWAIEIRLKKEKDDETIKGLIEQVCFYLTDKLGVAVYLWGGPDLNELYEHIDAYYNTVEDDESKVDAVVVNIALLPQNTPLLKMFRQAKGVNDPEIQFLQYYKIIEYVSPIVAKSVAYDRLNRRLDMLSSMARDAKFLDSILSIAKKYDTDMRDDSLTQSVIEHCVDVVPLFEIIPSRLKKKVKGVVKLQKDTIVDSEVTEEQIRGLQKQIATILYSTRNSIVHAKSNYQMTGNELQPDELVEANEMMEIITRSIINWNQRQPEGFRS